MLNLKNAIIEKLDEKFNIKKVKPSLYLLEDYRYLLFWDELITSKNIEEILDVAITDFIMPIYSVLQSIIIVGETEEKFKKADLVFYSEYHNVLTCYYLLNRQNGKRYRSAEIFTTPRKYIKIIDSVIKGGENCE